MSHGDWSSDIADYDTYLHYSFVFSDIAEGGLNSMLGLYKTLLPSLGGYLVDNANIQWDRLEKLIARISILLKCIE